MATNMAALIEAPLSTATTLGANTSNISQFNVNEVLMRQTLLDHLVDQKRDIDRECGYPRDIQISQYRYMYARHGIANRVVRLFPEECWSEDPIIEETGDPERTPWEQTVDDLCDEHNLMHYMHRIDELSGIGSFGVLLLGIGDGKQLNEPVDGIILDGPNAGRRVGFDQNSKSTRNSSKKDKKGKKTKKRKPENNENENNENENNENENNEATKELLYLRAFDEKLVRVASWENDETNRRFGYPKTYAITFNDSSGSSSSSASAPSPGGGLRERQVHWTRVIHVADNRTTSEVFGNSRMQLVFDRLYDLTKLLGGSAEMFWKGAFPGFAFELDESQGLDSIDKDAVKRQFDSYTNGLQRYLAIAGLKTKALSPQVADPDSHVMVQLKMVSIALGCPLRIFLGSEAGHLASTQDQKAWDKRVKQRQYKYLTPKIVRAVLDRFIAVGILGEPEDGTYDVSWPSRSETDEITKADIAEKLTRAIANYINSGAEMMIPPMQYLTIILGLPLSEAEAIMEAVEDLLIQIEDEEHIDGLLPKKPGADIEETQFDENGDEIEDEEDDEEDDEEVDDEEEVPKKKKSKAKSGK